MGESNPVPGAKGDLYVHAFVSNPNRPLLSRFVALAGRNESGEPVRVNLPISASTAADPFDLDPWPASRIDSSRRASTWGFLRGKLVTAWDARPQPMEFRLFDAIELFQEGNDGMWTRGVVMAADPDIESR